MFYIRKAQRAHKDSSNVAGADDAQSWSRNFSFAVARFEYHKSRTNRNIVRSYFSYYSFMLVCYATKYVPDTPCKVSCVIVINCIFACAMRNNHRCGRSDPSSESGTASAKQLYRESIIYLFITCYLRNILIIYLL